MTYNKIKISLSLSLFYYIFLNLYANIIPETINANMKIKISSGQVVGSLEVSSAALSTFEFTSAEFKSTPHNVISF